MIQPRNYCTHAIEQFNKFNLIVDEELAEAHGVSFSDEPSVKKGIDLLAASCITLLHRAEKFVLPDWGRIFDQEELKIFDDVEVPTRLPYPVIACEFFCDYQKHMDLGPHEMPSSRRIALMAERDTLLALAPFVEQVILPERALSPEGICILPICYFDAQGIWTPPPSAAWIDRRARLQEFKAMPLVTPLGLSSYSIYPENERLQRAAKDYSDECIAMIHLLLALSMERTHTETIAAPKKLNEKRARNRKPPLYEYKVLDIVADVMEAPKTGTSRPPGHHASPRLHKRRGHVRRLSTGKVTWVRNTIVGKPGRGAIRKDYKVHK